MREVAPVLKKAINSSVFLLALSLLGFCPTASATDIPEWLRNLSRQPAKSYADDVNAVILLEDQVTIVKDNGDLVRRGRRAVRILRPEGRDRFAFYAVEYNGDSKVNYLRGWSITSKGQEYETKSGDVSEHSISTYEVYSDAKVKALRVPGADVGTVVGFEYEQQERPYIFQDSWMFQQSEPVEQSHYELRLAAGWRFKSDWMNHKEEKPSEENGAIQWRLADIPRIEDEPHRPPARGIAGGVVFTFFNDKNPSKSYRNWSELGTWFTQLSSTVRDASPALSLKVQELAPPRLPTIQRIKALASFAQHDVRYVAVEVGVGGYRPHTATDIFTHRYGDCKDKATVLSSMLAQIGVKSYYIIVNATRGVVTKDSPASPGGFNHMILAIALPEASYGKPLPAMFEHRKLGHLLIFDPTNDFVPFGQIPPYEQDNYGLLVGEQGGELIHMPLSSPESNGINRTAKMKLLPDGTLQGEMEETYVGFSAMLGRMFLQNESEADRKKMIERLMGSSLGNFQLDHYELVNASDIDQDLIIRFKFSAAHYAKNAGSMLLVRPRVVGEMAGQWDANKPRHYAYDFRAPFLNRDSFEIALPEGFQVDELPDPAKASFPFAEYASKTENSGSLLKYTREYRITATQVDMDQMDQLKKLFGQINLDEKNMAVLKKTN
jgi:transglutaminase-like putative cysteine protease